MAVRSALIAHGSALVPSAGLTLFTCPEQRTAIVKDVVLTNNAGSTSNLTLQLRSAGVGVGVVREAVPDAGRTTATQRFIVLEPGDELRLLSSVNAGTCGWAISGSLLAGEPT